jgi:hypothetical protein
VISFSLWDATGKKLDLCSVLPGVSSPESVTSGVVNRNALSSDFPETDILLEVMANEIPCGGWGKYKAPYVADLELSDSGAWPMKVRVPIQLDKAIGDNEFPFRPGNHPH